MSARWPQPATARANTGHLRELLLEGHTSQFADQLRRGFPRLRFDEPLEQEFRGFYVAQHQSRTICAGLISLVVVLAVAAIDLALGGADSGQLNLVRLMGLAPLLGALTVAISLPSLTRWYMQIMAVGMGVIGLVVTYIAHAAALGGASYVLIDLVVVILYGCLFVGLLFNVAVYLAVFMLLAHVAAGLWSGAPPLELLHTSIVMAGAAAIGGISTYNLEHSLRITFLETGLLNELAERDGLTGLYNRRVFDDRVEGLWRHAQREGVALAIALVDIDQFKLINDLYGHQVGDECLRKVAQCVARGMQRPLDLAARYGGEEFALTFCAATEEHVRVVAEQIRRDVQGMAITHASSVATKGLTVSVGVAFAPAGSQRSLSGLIRLADEALYTAKRDGRNAVVFRAAGGESAGDTGKFRVITSEHR